MVFSHTHHMPTALAGRVWRLVDRPPDPIPTVHPKLCHRFENLHTSTVSASDGICTTELLNYNPRQFFGAGMSIRQMFNFKEMRRWLEHLEDVDEQGLPKAMVRQHWDRAILRGRLVERGGITCLDWSIKHYEYDPATDYWTILRAQHTVSYSKSQAPQ
jgi:hypothetical protein